MAKPSLPKSVIARHELEDAWRVRLEQNRRLYQDANTRYRGLLTEKPDGQPPSPESPLALARAAESEALMEYSRVLRIFTDLTVHGKLPNETVDAEGSRATRTLISVIDGDESTRDSTSTLLRSVGLQVETFASAEQFLESGTVPQTECVVLDVRPGVEGLELQRRLNAANVDVPIVFVTSHDDATNQHSAIDAGGVDFINKPFGAKSLLITVQTALARRHVRQ